MYLLDRSQRESDCLSNWSISTNGELIVSAIGASPPLTLWMRDCPGTGLCRYGKVIVVQSGVHAGTAHMRSSNHVRHPLGMHGQQM